MAWLFPEHSRKCPSCGHSERIHAIKDADGDYHLSCGWCARLSAPQDAAEAFFGSWVGEGRVQPAMRLSGIAYRWRGGVVSAPPPLVVWKTESDVQISEAT